MPRNSEIVSTGQQRIAELAKRTPKIGLTSLNQHLDLAWLQEAYRRTRKDAAVGVDGQTADEYEVELEANLKSLLERAKSGRYKAPPVRRVYIPKGTGTETRPIGIPTVDAHCTSQQSGLGMAGPRLLDLGGMAHQFA